MYHLCTEQLKPQKVMTMEPLKRFLLMLTLTCLWGPSFLFIKWAVQDLPPITIVFLRVSLAALILGGVLFWRREPLPTNWAFWRRASVMALFASVLPFCLFCYAEQTIDSALAAILNGTTPMFTAVLAQLFVASDRMNPQKVIGVFLSCLGIFLLFGPQLLAGVSGTVLGMSAALMASFCYAISHVYGKLYLLGHRPLVAPTSQFIVSSLILYPVASYYDGMWDLPMPSFLTIYAVCGLGILGTVFAFIVYYKLLDHCGPTAISTVACFFPVVGMFLGFIFLGESFTPLGLAAAAVILLGMLSVNESLQLIELPLHKKNE